MHVDANLASERTIVHSAAFAALFDAWLSLYLFPIFVVPKVQIVNRLGWLVQIQSSRARYRSPKNCHAVCRSRGQSGVGVAPFFVYETRPH